LTEHLDGCQGILDAANVCDEFPTRHGLPGSDIRVTLGEQSSDLVGGKILDTDCVGHVDPFLRVTFAVSVDCESDSSFPASLGKRGRLYGPPTSGTSKPGNLCRLRRCWSGRQILAGFLPITLSVTH
jgi:hypothetical protein